MAELVGSGGLLGKGDGAGSDVSVAVTTSAPLYLLPYDLAAELEAGDSSKPLAGLAQRLGFALQKLGEISAVAAEAGVKGGYSGGSLLQRFQMKSMKAKRLAM
jgi:hypothetical protein